MMRAAIDYVYDFFYDFSAAKLAMLLWLIMIPIGFADICWTVLILPNQVGYLTKTEKSYNNFLNETKYCLEKRGDSSADKYLKIPEYQHFLCPNNVDIVWVRKISVITRVNNNWLIDQKN